MSGGDEYLLVRAAGRRVGLPLAHLVEVVSIGPLYEVPTVDPAVRGLTAVRGRTVAVVHLGALLEGRGCPPVRGDAAVLLVIGGRLCCLEVDEAEAVLRARAHPVPPGTAFPWAVAVARHSDGLVPLLDLSALGARFLEAAS